MEVQPSSFAALILLSSTSLHAISIKQETAPQLAFAFQFVPDSNVSSSEQDCSSYPLL